MHMAAAAPPRSAAFCATQSRTQQRACVTAAGCPADGPVFCPAGWPQAAGHGGGCCTFLLPGLSANDSVAAATRSAASGLRVSRQQTGGLGGHSSTPGMGMDRVWPAAVHLVGGATLCPRSVDAVAALVPRRHVRRGAARATHTDKAEQVAKQGTQVVHPGPQPVAMPAKAQASHWAGKGARIPVVWELPLRRRRPRGATEGRRGARHPGFRNRVCPYSIWAGREAGSAVNGKRSRPAC